MAIATQLGYQQWIVGPDLAGPTSNCSEKKRNHVEANKNNCSKCHQLLLNLILRGTWLAILYVPSGHLWLDMVPQPGEATYALDWTR